MQCRDAGGAEGGGVAQARRTRLWVVRSVATSMGFALAARSAPAMAADTPFTIEPAEIHQSIDGFGASSAWTTQSLSPADADLLFSATKTDGGTPGIGLTLLRIRAAPDGTCLEVRTALAAQTYGVQVWATPWSPPAEWKTGTDDAGNGGSLLPAHYDDWANRLVQFLQSMQSQGVNVVGLSAQNEPTTQVRNTPGSSAIGYESCVYTAAQLTTFIGQNLGPALADAGMIPTDGGVGLIAPETQGWNEFPGFESAILADNAAAGYLGTVATHEYNGGPSQYNVGSRHFWETEVSQQNAAQDPGMGSALWMADEMHNALVSASVNAWHFWWIHPAGPDNSGLYNLPLDGGGYQPAKRMYVMGNFSRFVRPGFLRVGVTPSTQAVTDPSGPASINVSAYCDSLPCDGTVKTNQLVVVAINHLATAVTQTFQFDGIATGTWQSWVTSDALNLVPGDPISGNDAGTGFTYTLAPMSVTTLVGAVLGPAATIEVDAGPETPPVTNDGCGLACSTVGRLSDRQGEIGAIGVSAIAALASVFRARSRRRAKRSES